MKESHDYDFIIIDCSPSLGLITVNALTASDSVLVPVQCEYFALEGLGKLLNTIKIVQSRLNEELDMEGIVLTMYDTRLRLANQVVDEVKTHFLDLVFDTAEKEFQPMRALKKRRSRRERGPLRLERR